MLVQFLVSTEDYQVLTDKRIYLPQTQELGEQCQKFFTVIARYERTRFAWMFSEFRRVYQSKTYQIYSDLNQNEYFRDAQDWCAFSNILNLNSLDLALSLGVIQSIFSLQHIKHEQKKRLMHLMIDELQVNAALVVLGVRHAIVMLNSHWNLFENEEHVLLDQLFQLRRRSSEAAERLVNILISLHKAKLFDIHALEKYVQLSVSATPIQEILELMVHHELLHVEEQRYLTILTAPYHHVAVLSAWFHFLNQVTLQPIYPTMEVRQMHRYLELIATHEFPEIFAGKLVNLYEKELLLETNIPLTIHNISVVLVIHKMFEEAQIKFPVEYLIHFLSHESAIQIAKIILIFLSFNPHYLKDRRIIGRLSCFFDIKSPKELHWIFTLLIHNELFTYKNCLLLIKYQGILSQVWLSEADVFSVINQPNLNDLMGIAKSYFLSKLLFVGIAEITLYIQIAALFNNAHIQFPKKHLTDFLSHRDPIELARLVIEVFKQDRTQVCEGCIDCDLSAVFSLREPKKFNWIIFLLRRNYLLSYENFIELIKYEEILVEIHDVSFGMYFTQSDIDTMIHIAKYHMNASATMKGANEIKRYLSEKNAVYLCQKTERPSTGNFLFRVHLQESYSILSTKYQRYAHVAIQLKNLYQAMPKHHSKIYSEIYLEIKKYFEHESCSNELEIRAKKHLTERASTTLKVIARSKGYVEPSSQISLHDLISFCWASIHDDRALSKKAHYIEDPSLHLCHFFAKIKIIQENGVTRSNPKELFYQLTVMMVEIFPELMDVVRDVSGKVMHEKRDVLVKKLAQAYHETPTQFFWDKGMHAIGDALYYEFPELFPGGRFSVKMRALLEGHAQPTSVSLYSFFGSVPEVNHSDDEVYSFHLEAPSLSAV